VDERGNRPGLPRPPPPPAAHRSGANAWPVDQVGTGRRAHGRTSPVRLAFLIALGIGLHNLGEGLAIGSAYAVGELALGAALVVGFALHNTTEGIAVVAPLTDERPPLLRLLGLGLLAGAPAILGALIGAAVNNAELSALLLGVGVGAIVQVIIQVLPAVRGARATFDPLAVGGVAAGVLVDRAARPRVTPASAAAGGVFGRCAEFGEEAVPDHEPLLALTAGPCWPAAACSRSPPLGPAAVRTSPPPREPGGPSAPPGEVPVGGGRSTRSSGSW